MESPNKKSFAIALLTGLFVFTACANSGNGSNNENASAIHVRMETTMGDIIVKLYDETPQHRDNFLSLIEEDFYEGVLFHRVIEHFMIQAGDPMSRDAVPGEPLGSGGPGYTIPAEIVPGIYHQKGALAAARQGDQRNPERASSGSQFYIVQGRVFSEEGLNQMAEERDLDLNEEQREIYTTTGGAPHLDNAYTVFGQVIEGMEVVERIGAMETDDRDRPLEDVSIVGMEVIE